MITWLLSLLFGCQHSRYTWPLPCSTGHYVACLECGKEMAYDWRNLGGVPAQAAAPRVTAPRRFELDTPGRYQLETGKGVYALDIESRDRRGLVTTILLP